MIILSCRGLTAISRIFCVKSTAQRESLYRYVCVWIAFSISLSLSSLLSLSFFSFYIHPLSLSLSQDVKPWFVATVMSGIQRASRFAPDPITYTRAAVATIGIQHTTYGYFYHALQVGLFCHGYRSLSLFSGYICTHTHTHTCIHTYAHTSTTLHTQAYVLCLVPGRLLDLLVTVVAAKQVFLKKKAKQS